MDSDDDFNSSQASGDGFMEDQDSDLGLEDGKDSSSSCSEAHASDTWTADSDFDMDQDDVGFESQDKDMGPRKQAYEVDFKVFDPQQIQASQDKQIDEVSSILGQPPEATAILLRHLRWNKERLIDRYMDNQEEVLESAGLGETAANNPPKVTKVDGFVCDICCEDGPDLETFAMKCGHRFCTDCYRQYLYTKIKEEGEAARIKCPGDGCNRIVDSKSLDLLMPEDIRDRYVISDIGLRANPTVDSMLTSPDITSCLRERTSTIRIICGGAPHPTASTLSSAELRTRT